MTSKEKLEFFMSQLQLATDLRIKIETQRLSSDWDKEPYESLKKAYLAELEVLRGKRED